MKKFIINVQEVQNNEYGDAQKSVLQSGLLVVENRWDALKVARNLAKKVSRTRVYACEETEAYWRHGCNGEIVGFSVMRTNSGVMAYEHVGIIVTIHELQPETDGIEWGEI